jgi:signal peptidase II
MGSGTIPEPSLRTSTISKTWRLDIILALVIALVFALDQISKAWVRNHLISGGSIPAEGFIRITHVANTGSAFGLFPNQTTLLMLGSVLGIGIILLFYRKQPIPGVWLRASLGLQLGGAAGNLADRITLGSVTDFIDVGAWPIFNLADSSIMLGIGIFTWFLLRAPKRKPEGHATSSQKEHEASAPSALSKAEREV